MGLRELWRQSNEVIREEHDERAEVINLRVTCAVLAAASLTAFAGIVLLLLLPLSGDHLRLGLGLVPPAMLVAGAAAQAVALRLHGPPSPSLQRAATQRALLLGLPVLGGLVAGLADLLAHGDPGQALRLGLALMLGSFAGLGAHLWLLHRRGRHTTDADA
jgi:hypothetical protein